MSGKKMNQQSDFFARDEEIKRLYAFVAEQVTAGLFKSDILDILIEMGVARQTAFELLEEIERRMANLRKRKVLLVMSEGKARTDLLKEFSLSGYDVRIQEDLDVLREQLAVKVPDLIVTEAFDRILKARDVLRFLRSDIIGKNIPVFILSSGELKEDTFASWEGVRVFTAPCSADQAVKAARELFLKKFKGNSDVG
jgi:response regulator RpfG family c-di-GMP phosphodiesterase